MRVDSRAYTLRINSGAICNFPRQPLGAARDQGEEKGSQLCGRIRLCPTAQRAEAAAVHSRATNEQVLP